MGTNEVQILKIETDMGTMEDKNGDEAINEENQRTEDGSVRRFTGIHRKMSR